MSRRFEDSALNVHRIRARRPIQRTTRLWSSFTLTSNISIRAPHAGGDGYPGRPNALDAEISIRAPHAGSDKGTGISMPVGMIFQSALPMRGATKPSRDDFVRVEFQSALPMRGATVIGNPMGQRGNFNPRSPCGERLVNLHATDSLDISIRAPLAGSDLIKARSYDPKGEFQSALPLRGATAASVRRAKLLVISIRAPLAGSDFASDGRLSCWGDFNPRSPCGERPRLGSTAPLRRYFNPRSPCGERRNRRER